eukprot:gene3644-6460_t
MFRWFTGAKEDEDTSKLNPNLQKLIDKTMDDYNPPTKEEFETFIKEVSSTEDWSLVAKNEVGRIYKQQSKISTINIIKGNVDWEEKASVIFALLKDDEFYIKSSQDSYFLDWKLLEKIDENTHISYYAASAPLDGLFSPRDFVTLRSYYKINENEYSVLLRSVEHQKAPEMDGRIRAHVYLTGYYIKDTEQGCNLWMMTQADIRGYIPGWVINWAASVFAPQQFERLHGVVRKYAKSIQENE